MEVMEVLQTMYPGITVPEPVAVHMPVWASNPLFYGSYSNYGPSYVPAQSENLKATVNNPLWFAGEATNVKYYGTSFVWSVSKYLLTRFLFQVSYKGPTSRVKALVTPSLNVFTATAVVVMHSLIRRFR